MKVPWGRFATATARANPLSWMESTFMVRGVDGSGLALRRGSWDEGRGKKVLD